MTDDVGDEFRCHEAGVGDQLVQTPATERLGDESARLAGGRVAVGDSA